MRCKRWVEPPLAFRQVGECPSPEERGGAPVMFEDKGAVLYCDPFLEPHEHEWPDDYTPLNPRPR